ncbi:MAG TPA: hypothetical protein VK571_00970 [Gemmatimonadaceae bacterium]|nr:hypothetical protein [Gemmatimonadaceae bacterium]
MNTHPEQQPGEIYLGNSNESGLMEMDWHTREPRDPSGFKSSSWKTKRLGKVAYMADGTRMDDDSGYRPWFIQRSEVEETIATTKHESLKVNLQSMPADGAK